MRLIIAMALASSLFVACALAQAAPDSQNAKIIAAEAWAFPGSSTKARALKPDPHKRLHVPGSTRTYTAAELNAFNPPDWFPQDHPPMPQIVAHGRKPVLPCALCHRPNGGGFPDTASLAGLPKAYILEQINAFRSGERGKGLGGKQAQGSIIGQEMAEEARGISNTELQQAATYFSTLTLKPNLRVIETATVPKTHWYRWVLVPDTGDTREPIGERIIETPANVALDDLDDPHSGYVAYVPPGSIARGKTLVAKGNGTVRACESCHGADLHGVGNIPRLAGRSPTYIVRQLILFKLGGRTNSEAAPMRAVASQLTLKDMIDAAAYAASIKR